MAGPAYPISPENPDHPAKVTVLAGGIGSERDISLQSGACITEALNQTGCPVSQADITPDDLSALETETDAFFVALHGKFGEDGSLQRILQQRNLAYTGSGPRASELAFDKAKSKEIFKAAGIATPPAIFINTESDIKQLSGLSASFGPEFVVKPTCQGSSVGIEIVDTVDAVAAAAKKCFQRYGPTMVEKFIPGREVTVGILAGRALPVVEVKSKTGFYDFHAKYIDEATEYYFESIETAGLNANLKSAAINCFDALGCRDFARVDFILSEEEIAYALEVNTIPGFTSHSLLPKAAEKAGIAMPQLVAKIVADALSRHAKDSIRKNPEQF